MAYSCKLCDFNTANKSNLATHNLTRKHIKKSQQAKNTEIDEILPANLQKHTEKIKLVKDTEINEILPAKPKNNFQKIIDGLDELYKTINPDDKERIHDTKFLVALDKIKNQQTEINALEARNEMLEGFYNMYKTKPSVTALTYVMQNHYEPPVLQKISNPEKINDNGTNDKFIGNIIFLMNNEIMHRYIGDYILGRYKPPKPQDQQLWNTDANRLHFIVRKNTSNDPNNSKIEWVYDKGGVCVIEYLIIPITDYMEQEICNFLCSDYMKHKRINKSFTDEDMDTINVIGNYKKVIHGLDLHKQALKYIAEGMYLNKNNGPAK